jgi:hypothetical protein
MAIFGGLAVRLDPWQLDDVEEAAPDEAVALDVEVAPQNWQPIRPGEAMAVLVSI